MDAKEEMTTYDKCRFYNKWICQLTRRGCTIALEYVTRFMSPDGQRCPDFKNKNGNK